MKLKLVLSYVGTVYCGWQIQEWKTRTKVATVQGEIEKALESILKYPVRVIGSGRTDTGVHAEGQVAHCQLKEYPEKIHWQKAINNFLPTDIRVVKAELVEDNFHAQFQAKHKIYTYTLWTEPYYTPPRLYPFVWSCFGVDFSRIETAIPYLIGEKDFASFQNSGTSVKNTVRTLENIVHVQQDEYLHEFIFTGKGFLKQMVRNLMGFLVHVGQGKIEKENISQLLTTKAKRRIYLTAPAKGLTLTKVLYDDEI